MGWLQALVLGIVEGVTEFLPVSSTGHLTIVEKLMGLPVADAGVTAFTAIIQVGAILAVIVYFRRDIVRLVLAFVRGLSDAAARRDPSWREALVVIVGTIPIGIVGLAATHKAAAVAISAIVLCGLLVGFINATRWLLARNR